jgi:hypothetical protein
MGAHFCIFFRSSAAYTFVFLGVGLFCFWVFSMPVWAKEDLEKALKSGKKVINFSGKEGEDVKIPRNTSVVGKSVSQAVINGDVRMENGSVLKNVTVNAQVVGITVEKGASVTLENVVVKGAADTGIFTKEGGGTLTVRNSKIIQNRKGFYILPGKTVVVANNEIARNKEEGIDIRKGVGGSISGNQIVQNGEGGAEIIVGSSSLTVNGNTFASNKSSGLALQFYPDAKKIGQMSVHSNTFSGNGNFGIVCKSPSGGNLPPQFFRNSVKLSQNRVVGNREGSIYPGCRLTNVFPQERKLTEVVDGVEERDVKLNDEDVMESRGLSLSEAEAIIRELRQNTPPPSRWALLRSMISGHFMSPADSLMCREE